MKEEIIKNELMRVEAAAVEIVKAQKLDLSTFSKIISKYPDSISYLKRNLDKIENPGLWFEDAKSVLICLFRYNSELEHDKINEIERDPQGFLERKKIKIPEFIKGKKFSIARYARPDDYHRVLREKVEKALKKAKEKIHALKWKIFVDSSPVAEKIWAAMSGLAFTGKNTLAINEKTGSYFNIAGAMLNIETDSAGSEAKSLCGDCLKCVQACPTGALTPYVLNPERCISYWTTHNRKSSAPPPEILPYCEKNFGCDICQEVCPYNQK